MFRSSHICQLTCHGGGAVWSTCGGNQAKTDADWPTDKQLLQSRCCLHAFTVTRCLKMHQLWNGKLKIIRIDFGDIWQKYSEDSKIEFACFSFHVGLLLKATFSLSNRTPKIMHEFKGCNTWQFITRDSEQRLDEEQHQQAAGEVQNSRQASGQRQMQTAVRILMKTSTQLSRCCWVRKTNLRATEQSEKFHVRRGINRSSVSWIIHKDLRLKCYKKRRAQQLTVAHSIYTLFSVCSLRDDKQTYIKTETCKLF